MRQATFLFVLFATILLGSPWLPAAAAAGPPPGPGPGLADELRTLDGRDNNRRHPEWGQAGNRYLRVAPANYADGIGQMVAGPNARMLSNRIFNDTGQNLFSENALSQWVWAWGQFLDHDLGLRDETPGESADIPYSATDPLEGFVNDLGVLSFNRTPAAPGSGIRTPRQQVNTVSSYIDGSNVYGTTASRLDWLRAGPADGDPTNNLATLLLPDGFLPRADARGNVSAAPPMDLMGGLTGNPGNAVVAGDVRANENVALTAIQTLFAREHNRIVGLLPATMRPELKFQIARRIVGAEIQFITYNEFLPQLGVDLGRYRGYDPDTNATLGNEFATVGFRAHSMVHGEFEPTVPAGTYSDAQLAAFATQGMDVERDPGSGAVTLVIPLSLAFGNPGLLNEVGLGAMLSSLGERQYKNDEQIDNTLRSVLFEVPRPGNLDPGSCAEPVVNPACFSGVVDLGADDIMRDRDHGIPSYNALRRAYGLSPKGSFTAITGESTDRFPADPLLDPKAPGDDLNSLDFVSLLDQNGQALPVGTADGAIVGVRRTTLAARLRAVYGSVDKVDAFAGMLSERHVRGTDFGELQLAIWRRQFTALRDGDRFFYLNDPALAPIERQFGISFRHTLSEIVSLNAGVSLPAHVFQAVP